MNVRDIAQISGLLSMSGKLQFKFTSNDKVLITYDKQPILRYDSFKDFLSKVKGDIERIRDRDNTIEPLTEPKARFLHNATLKQFHSSITGKGIRVLKYGYKPNRTITDYIICVRHSIALSQLCLSNRYDSI